MKTLKDYLTESKKTYAVRVKIAGDLPESFDSKFKTMMSKYEVVSMKKTATTPIQEHPHEFPRIKNKEVHIYDVESAYPISFPQLEQVVSEAFGIAQDHIRVKHPADTTEEPAPEPTKEPRLMDADYNDDPAKGVEPTFGDKYNMSLFKELMSDRKESERETGTKTTDKIVDMGEGNNASPIVPNKK
jgi:hypothetical protein